MPELATNQEKYLYTAVAVQAFKRCLCHV